MKQKAHKTPKERLEYLRGELRAERISYGELAELQGLTEYIDPNDVELLEAAGVPEFPSAHYMRLELVDESHIHPDCGCELQHSDNDGSVSLFQCPLHAAAPDLLAMLERVCDELDGDPHRLTLGSACVDVIRLAKGQGADIAEGRAEA